MTATSTSTAAANGGGRPADSRSDRDEGARATTMPAVFRERWGAPADVLRVGRRPRPTPAEGQVLVEVAAAGLDRGTEHLVTGLPYLLRLMGYGLARPSSPVIGFEVAGHVTAVGPGVTRLAPGDRVFGIAAGSFAAEAVADEEKLARLPDEVSFVDAAVSAISGATAMEAVEDVAAVRPGQSVLVVGASGGVGLAAVRLAVAAGATVTGVASPAKLDAVRAAGAAAVVDYTTTDPFATDQRFDVVLDVGGRAPVSRLRRVLRRDGTLVFVGGEGGNRLTGGIERAVLGMLLSPFVSQRLAMFISREHHEVLDRVAAHLATGDLVPLVDRRVGLADVPAALADLSAGRVTGKVAVLPPA